VEEDERLCAALYYYSKGRPAHIARFQQNRPVQVGPSVVFRMHKLKKDAIHQSGGGVMKVRLVCVGLLICLWGLLLMHVPLVFAQRSFPQLPLPPRGPVPATFFSMTIHAQVLTGEPWPAVGFGGIRLWDTQTTWASLNPSRNVYRWKMLDSWLSLAESKRVDVLYTFGDTPTWASSNPTGPCFYNAGGCSPPADLDDWDDFVTALAKHAKGRIKYWELWNEANLPNEYWSGDIPTLVRMAQHAHRIIKSVDPSAIVLTPSATGGADEISLWLGRYLAAGGGISADAIAFHGYPPSTSASPEYINDIMDSITTTLRTYGQDGKPVWDTESSWGLNQKLPNPDDQAAYVARGYVLHWLRGIGRFYWYAWNNGSWGTLYDTSSKALLESGVAYGEVYKWLSGATMTRCSVTNNSTWVCSLTRPGGYDGQIVWNSAAATGTTLPFTPPGEFERYRDLRGNVTVIQGGGVRIGSKPILLENGVGFPVVKHPPVMREDQERDRH
jgi:hypothetical protein